MTPQSLILLAGAGLVAGAVNAIAGAGSLVTLPALMFLGLPANVANATGRVGVILQSSASSAAFYRKGALDLTVARRLMLPSCACALLGSLVSAVLDPALFRQAMAVILLGVLVITLAPGLLERARWPSAWPRWPLFVVVGFYGGFLQAGVGLLLLAAMQAAEGLDLVRANGVKALLVAGFTAVALLVFGVYGLIDWRAAGVLSIGSTLGGWIGGNLAMAGGARLIKVMLTVTVLAAVAQLLDLI